MADALTLVEDAENRLWTTSEGEVALNYLTGTRYLDSETIRAARLGWTPGVRLAAKGGRTYTARGVVIPWFDGDRLALVKLRQPEGARPKYAEAYRDRPSLYPGSQAIFAGRPLVVAEGEFDALLLVQELNELAGVVTLGSASGRLESRTRAMLRSAAPWYIGTDADDAGDKAAEAWPRPRSRRARPPGPFNDWTEARHGGVDLRRWWASRLAGIGSPPAFSWPDLAALRWGSDEHDPEPGIIIDRPNPDLRMAALASLRVG
ncbi:toprim domain-containing protein [Tundrisphaera lichenicola]|uniref:toprim domain-containing protein n=1 Tax=Tundrisphaera lichenicola TaxID=2029860 RepID=UPI003EB70E13